MKADKDYIMRLLKTSRGQIDGIMKMVEDDRYCVDIVNQVSASIAILRKVENEILSAHMLSCVMNAEGEEREVKIKELIKIMNK